MDQAPSMDGATFLNFWYPPLPTQYNHANPPSKDTNNAVRATLCLWVSLNANLRIINELKLLDIMVHASHDRGSGPPVLIVLDPTMLEVFPIERPLADLALEEGK